MNKIKKILTMSLFALTLFTLPLTTKASTEKESLVVNQNKEPKTYGTPISESSYTDENGAKITEQIYFVPANTNTNSICSVCDSSSVSGEGWYKKERTHEWNSKTKMKYWVKGYFKWGNGKVSLTKSSKGISNVPKKVKLSNVVKSNSNNSVKLSFTATTPAGNKQKFSVKIKVTSRGLAL